MTQSRCVVNKSDKGKLTLLIGCVCVKEGEGEGRHGERLRDRGRGEGRENILGRPYR